ncbi:hypothetical protein NI17_002310 [Thermobifida halotolerans]|uniref:Uncharacterized protein n=1 Tax=Thermobifida halotolerans TaxID=483545 RepID=A0A399G2W8_9ACTN|nr:hypothetical protein [Thermobifida halotolerans]UOE20101.1 hypothetical protein NI17_002310 [Thermobifida halotolerans]
MEIVYSALVFLHFVALAGIVSGWLMQQMGGYAKAPKVLLHSALTQLVIGLLLVGLREMGDLGAVDHVKIGVKLVVNLAVVVLAVLNVRGPSPRLALAAGLLTLLNIGVAVFW